MFVQKLLFCFFFFLDKKRNKKVKAVGLDDFYCFVCLGEPLRGFDAGDSLDRRFPITNCRLEKCFILKGLMLEPLLRAIARFMKALNFSLNVFRCLVLAFSEK
jgi:hypothetical protein